MRRLLVLVLVLVLVLETVAAGSDTDVFGLGSRPIALGNAYTALATDWTAPYYNPAGLAAAPGPTLGGGVSYADYEMRFKTASGGAALEHDAERVPPLSAVFGGFSTRLGAEGTILGRFAAGIAAFVPTRHTLTLDVETGAGDPGYFLYGPHRDRLNVLPGIAFRIPLPGDLERTQTLAIGVAANVLFNAEGEQTFDLSGGATSETVVTDIDADYNISPNVGLFYWPLEGLSVGLTYRAENSSGSEINVIIDLTGTGQSAFPLDLRWVTLFQPQQVQAGVAIDPTEALTFSLDLTWYDWSSFEDPFITVGTIVAQTDPDFHDTFVPRLGVEVEPGAGVALRLGYFYEPSPVPTQRGATNLVDLDKHVASFGVGWTYWTTRPSIVRGEGGALSEVEEPWNAFSIDAFFQWHHLVEETVTKNDPASSGGVGAAYEASGEIYNFGISFVFRP